MHLPTPIENDKTALARIVAGLFAMLGLSGAGAPQMIARSLYGAVVTVLRPAESAVRRLIYLVSLTIRAKAAPVRSMPSGIVRSGESEARPCFRLFDPRQRFFGRAKAPPARPRLSFFGDGEVRTIDFGRDAQKNAEGDGLIHSAKILRRLAALKYALDDLPRQARRLARALQRRSASPELKLQGPMRPGFPPGHRARRVHEIDHILARCHWRAREALPDTS